MAKAFDPYHRWLGISPKEQPPNHYRLLAIEPFEDSPDVIEAAADQRMAHLRNYQSGKHSELSQKLLNEVAAAKVRLLNPQKKAGYDRQLRERLEAKRRVIPQAEPLEPAEPEEPVDSGLARLFEKTGGGDADIARAQHARDRRQVQMTAGAAIVVVGLIAVVGLIVWANRSSSETVLSLDWPEHERRTGSLQIDGRRVDLYATGPLEYPVAPGDHRVTAARPGYERFEEKFTLAEGKKLILRPEWRKLPPKPAKQTPKPAPSTVERKVPETKAVPKPAEVEKPKVAKTQGPAKPQAAPETKPARMPVPPAEERERVARQLGEIYELSKDRKPDERRTLAGEMIGLAEKSAKPAEQYVLLHTAAELTCEAGGAVEMLDILDKLAAAFEVDILAEKAAMLRTVAAGAKDSAQIAALLAAADNVIDEALSHQKYDLALALAEEAYKACAQSAGREHRKRAFDRRKQVQALAASFQGLQSVLEKLKTDPDDPEANLAAGRHYCFDRGDWDKGLPHLAKSGDAELKKLAEQELQSPPPDADAMIKLADAWWDLAEARKGKEMEALMLWAGTWYREAEPDVKSVLLRSKVNKRLGQIAKLDQPVPEPSAQGQPTAAVAPFDNKQAKRHQQRWARHLDSTAEMKNSIGMKLVLIPPGEFMMGSPEEDADAAASEKPRHRARLIRPLFVGKYEVSQGEYAAVMRSNPSQSVGQTLPVDQVSWDDAVEFCRRLSAVFKERAAGRTYRLPTEAEWEYACRAGTTSPYWFGDKLPRGRADSGRTAPIGSSRANPWGLHDMHGNVMEWCADWYDEGCYKDSVEENPKGPASSPIAARAIRGLIARPSAARNSRCPGTPLSRLGFRVACDIGSEGPGSVPATKEPPPAAPLARWDFGRSTDGWGKENQCTTSVKDGLLVVQSTSGDPQVVTPLRLPGGAMVFRVKARVENQAGARIYWRTDRAPSFSADRTKVFPLTADGQWHNYAVRFEATGLLTGLRFDPGHTPGKFEIDWIELVRATAQK